MSDMTSIAMPLWQLPVIVLAPIVSVAALMALLRRISLIQSAPEEERDWSVPPFDDGAGTSLLHTWDVRCKIITILIHSFVVASLIHLKPAICAVALSLTILAISRVSLVKVVMRLMAITGFISMFLIIMPFSAPIHPGDTVLIFGGMGWTGFNLRGVLLAVTIAAKAVAITLLMEPLLSTAPLPVTLYGLSRLGVPEMVSQMVLLSYRYLHVFRHEASRMSSGMKVRGFRKQSDMATLHAVANFLGMLFVRSFERTERVFDAMRARGYRGSFPDPVELNLRSRDLILTGVWITAATLLILFDRILL